MLLQDQVAVVTGGARGIGLAIARRFHADGATVVVADLDGDAALAAASEVGERAEGVPCDVAEEASVTALFEGVLNRHGQVGVLINNAGVTRDAMMHKMALTDFDAVLGVHLRGTWLCSRAALTHMRVQGSGAIVNMSSISGKIGNLGQTNYAAAKAGIVGMTKAIAREGARFGVRANAIQPGLIDTAMTRAMPEEVFDAKVADVPMGRAGDPSEVADAALFLASSLSSYITGITIEVAGGRHM